VSVLAAARKVEAERPKEVSLATIDAERWDENRRLERPAEPRKPPPVERTPLLVRPDRIGERQMLAAPARRGARAGEPGGSPTGEPPSPSDGAAGGPELASSGDAAGGPDLRPSPPGLTADLRPPAQFTSPTPLDSGGTGFANLTVLTPDAWRFRNFFDRAVESMDAVYRYELGAPVTQGLRQAQLASPGRGAICSWTAVTLDAHGRVLEARVRKSSGASDVDDLIVEVIRRTAPYVNLPHGLLDDRGSYSDSWGLCFVWNLLGR
jgi:hypothetical protein